MAKSRKRQSPGSNLDDRLKNRDESIRRQRELIATLAVKRHASNEPKIDNRPGPIRDEEELVSALGEYRFYRVGEDADRKISGTYVELLKAAIRVSNTGDSEVILWWPAHQPCLSALVALLALGDGAAVKKRQIELRGNTDIIADAPLGMRVILYPYARTAHTLAREVHVDRTTIGKLHISHLLRSVSGEDDPALKDYHQVLSRVNSITGKGADGSMYAELQHPILDEVIPHGSPSDGCGNTGHLLWHTKTKTDLREQSRSGIADDPKHARFYLYSIRPSRNFKGELKHIVDPPDFFLMDLSKAGRARLGRDWVEIAKKSAEIIKSTHPTTGVLAVTDDPWAYDAVRFDVLGKRLNPRRKQLSPANASSIFSRTDAILRRPAKSSEIWEGASEISVDGFAGQVDDSVSAVRSVANKLRDRRNVQGAEAARSIIGKMRRCVSLPGSLAELSDFLERETNEVIAADNLSSYRISAELSILSDRRYGASQVPAADLDSAISKATELIKTSEQSTPMSTLVEEALGPTLRSSSRSVFVFRNEMIADFCGDRLGAKYPKLEERLETSFIRFVSKQGFEDLASLEPAERHQIKRVFFVAPTRQTIMELFAQTWLPDHVGILADSDTLSSSVRDAKRLAAQLEQPELARRLSTFADEADDRVKQLGDHLVILDRSSPPAEDVEFPFGEVVDLAGPQYGGDQTTIQFGMENGQKIIARPGTSLVLRDRSRSVPRFIEVQAKDVNVGDEICVIGPAFIEKARSLLNITAAAAEEIRDYHSTVIDRFSQLPGASDSERLSVLCDRMDDPDVSTTRAKYWIDLQGESEKPIYEVVPHAPRDKSTFLLFADALGIGQALAERFWAWAVIAQRSNRLRAGVAFHDAYKGILTDPHAVTAGNSERSADIRALRAAAEDFVSQVSARKVDCQ